jgi:ABC-type lipoprotein release transport system permease subunit
MGRLLLAGRLALRDLRRRRAESVLLLLSVLAATTTLTLGLVLRDAAADPYRSTRAATNGPDVIASGPADRLAGLSTAAGVTDRSGPFPIAKATLRAGGRTSDVQAVGRDADDAPVDRPELISGGWTRSGSVVVEAAFAGALGVHVNDVVVVNGRSFSVAGVAVTAAAPPYPQANCYFPCAIGDGPDIPPGVLRNPGLVWLTQADVRGLTDSPVYVVNLKLADPDRTQSFIAAHNLQMRSWQEILADATDVAKDSQILLLIGAWLLGLLAVASLSVLVGGRMADQTRRVGLLKAAGGTPGMVAAVLLAEYVLVALAAAAGGLAIGSLTAPLLTGASSGLVGSAAPPPLTLSTAVVVTLVALGVAVLASFVPALRAARSSTVNALADAPRQPRRIGWLIAASARLPVPLLLAVRVAARRPRRVVLAVVSVAVTVSGVYVALILGEFLDSHPPYGGYDSGQVAALRHVLLVWTVILLGLAAVNAIVITWATVLDNRRASALARALGATPRDLAAALAAAQVLPALAGAALGIFPGGYGLFIAIIGITGGDSSRATLPAPWQLLTVVLATVVVVGALTALPARLGGRRPVTEGLGTPG